MTVPPKKTDAKLKKAGVASTRVKSKPTAPKATQRQSGQSKKTVSGKDIKNDGNWTGEKASQLKAVISKRASEETQKHKGTVAHHIQNVSSALEKVGADNENPIWFSNFTSEVSAVLNTAAKNINSKNPEELLDTARSYVKSNPAIFVAGCAVVGFALSRVLKAGNQGGL